MIAQEKGSPFGLYVHVPFCASTCDFCAFYQEKPRRGEIQRYLERIRRDFETVGAAGRQPDTIFWGGGTPGLLAPGDLRTLGEAQLALCGEAFTEWTVEMAPSTVKPEKLQVLRDLGVTRVSMGVQSFAKETLDSLGRLHSPKQIFQAWERIQNAGFPQTNLDLIFGAPGQTEDAWLADLQQAITLGPEHISTYCLTFEEDTKLYLKLNQGLVRRDEAMEIRLLEAGWSLLAGSGYAQYEISNFARAGSRCVHNVHTWRMHEWIGCGPSAASQCDGRRFHYPSSLEEWLAMPPFDPKAAADPLTPADLAIDRLIFGLRMNEGVHPAELRARFGDYDPAGHINRLLEDLRAEGLIESSPDPIRLTHAGRLTCDGIGSAFLEAAAAG